MGIGSSSGTHKGQRLAEIVDEPISELSPDPGDPRLRDRKRVRQIGRSRAERRRNSKKSRKEISRLLSDMEFKILRVESLKPYGRNARTHPDSQIDQIVESIVKFGFRNPLLIDENGCVIAGHGRLTAASRLQLKQVPVIRITGLSDAKKRALRLADNKIAANAGWDLQSLALELSDLSKLELDFDLAITGFEVPQIDGLIQSLESVPSDDADGEDPTVDLSGPPVSRIGDLWEIDRHRLLCADATKRPSFRHLLFCEQAQMVITDPPYNLKIDGNVSGLGSIRHREFVMASGEMSERDFIAFLRAAFGNLVRFSLDGSIHFIFMDWRHISELFSAARGLYSELKNLCIWNKGTGGMGSMYRSQHELVFAFKNGKRAHINNVELGRFGRNRTNVWTYPGGNSLREGRRDELAMHPTVKPVAMIADAILDCSRRGGIILDCFGGSGSTLVAAQKTGRSARLMELDPIYVDMTIRRFKKLYGVDAIHADTKRRFSDLELERSESIDIEKRRSKRSG